MLRRIHRALIWAQRLTERNPKRAIGVLLLLLAASAVGAYRLRFLVMVGELLDPNFETYQSFHDLNRDFVEANNVAVIVAPSQEGQKGDHLSYRDHCDLIAWMNDALSALPQFQKVVSTYGAQEIVKEGGKVRVAPILAPLCTGAGATPTGAEADAEIASQLARIRALPSGRCLTSRDHDDVMITFYLRDLPVESRTGRFDVDAVDQLRKSFAERFLASHPKAKGIWAGNGTYQYHLQKAYIKMVWVNLLTGLLALLAFRIFFGTWRSGVLFLSTFGACLTLVYGFMGFIGFPVDSLSCAAPIMLLLATLEDFVFVSFRQRAGASVRRSFRSVLIPCFFTSLTTFVGFSALAFVNLRIIARFGVICSVGAFLEWAIVFLFLPPMISALGIGSWVAPAPGSRLLSRVAKHKAHRWLALALLSVYLISPYGLRWLEVSDSPERIFPDSHPVPEASEFLMQSRGFKSELSVVYGDSVSAARKRELDARLEAADPDIAGIESAERVFAAASRGLEASDASLMKSYWETSKSASRWISPTSASRRTQLFSKSTDILDIVRIRDRIREICGTDCAAANILVSYSEFGSRIVSSLLGSFGSSLLFVLIILAYLCRKRRPPEVRHWSETASLLAAAFWGPVALLSFFVIFKIKVFFATSVVMSVLVGLAGDNTIQYLYSERRDGIRAALDRTGVASLIVSLMMSAVALGFLGSDFGGVRKIGALMVLGFALITLGDLTLLQGLLRDK